MSFELWLVEVKNIPFYNFLDEVEYDRLRDEFEEEYPEA